MECYSSPSAPNPSIGTRGNNGAQAWSRGLLVSAGQDGSSPTHPGWLHADQRILYFLRFCVAKHQKMLANDLGFAAFEARHRAPDKWNVIAAILMPRSHRSSDRSATSATRWPATLRPPEGDHLSKADAMWTRSIWRISDTIFACERRVALGA
jgi:hypothetical protein